MSTQSVKTDRPATSLSFLWGADWLAAQWQDFLLLVGRVMIGWIFVQSGFRKLSDMNVFIYEGPNSLVGRGVPGAGFWGWIGAPLEFIGGLLILLGFASRYAALAIFIFTVVATLIAHRYWEFSPPQRAAQHSHFFKNLSMMGGLLVLFVVGTGRYAVDSLLRRRTG